MNGNPRQLRPGRHRLTRDEVHTHQRDRILGALEAVMSEKGYLDTAVADVLKRAGVSRQTFYQLFSSKLDCFLAGYALRQATLIKAILEAPPAEGAPIERFGELLQTYLSVMAADPGLARLYLVGVYTAGPEAVAQRVALQQQFVDGVAMVVGAQSEQERFACQALVAAVSTLVTHAVLDDDAKAVLDLYEPLRRLAEKMLA